METGNTDIKDRIDELRAQIAENNRLYYVESAPVISDYEYDMLMNDPYPEGRQRPEKKRRRGGRWPDGNHAPDS